ncbi:MAG: hypothetical protein K8R10_03495 [Rhodocyclales bacterium]|jgi:hypothetical protein|nr:hypothetical protein [Rhodocyclales bacterium]
MDLHSFDVHCLELLEKSPNKISRHCFRSAINHLQRAEKLFDIDNPMAAFRCYTAEEEAASGLMHCLKEGGYLNSSELKPQYHLHKSALIPFFSILCQFIEDSFRQYGIEIDLLMRESNARKYIALEVAMASSIGPVKFAPHPPFNFSFVHEGKSISYRQQIDKFVESKDAREIKDCLRQEANKRNKVLYATPQGFLASIEITPKFLPAYWRRVMAMLRAYLMIEPYKEPQPFVQDSLNAFLAMVISLKQEDLHEAV